MSEGEGPESRPPAEPAPGPAQVMARVSADLAHEVVVNVLAAIALAGLAFVVFGGRVEDLYLRTRLGAPTSGHVTLLGIDEESFYLWDPATPSPEVTPRALLAELVRVLTVARARVVVLDILTDTPAPGDEALLAAVSGHGHVVAAERFSPGRAGDARPFQAGSLLAGAADVGYANLGTEEQTLFSGEMLVRETPLVARVDRARLTGPFPDGLVGGEQTEAQVLPALSLVAASRFAGKWDPAVLTTRCPEGTCEAGASLFGLPDTAPLHQAFPINFRGPESGDGIPTVSAARLLRIAGVSALARKLGAEIPIEIPDDLRAVLADRLVVIGRTDAAGGDVFVTPYGFPAMIDADMSGARIQAQLIDTLLTGRGLRRVGGSGAWLAALAVGAAVVLTRRRSWHLLMWLGASVALVIAGTLIFRWTDGLALEITPTLVVLGCALVAVHLYARGET